MDVSLIIKISFQNEIRNWNFVSCEKGESTIKVAECEVRLIIWSEKREKKVYWVVNCFVANWRWDRKIAKLNEIMASLIRALSWPLISTSPLEVPEKNCSGNHNLVNGKNGTKHIAPTFQQLIAARRLICRRYYPEGGFGWVILFVGVVVNVLTHGLQISASSFLMPAGDRFKLKVPEVEVDCLGKLKCINVMGRWEVVIIVSGWDVIKCLKHISPRSWSFYVVHQTPINWEKLIKPLWSNC